MAREPDLEVVQASRNASSFLALRGELLGTRLDAIPGDLIERIEPHLGLRLGAIPHAVRCRIGAPRADFDCLFHRPPQGGLVLEIERAGPAVDLADPLDAALRAIRSAASLQELCDDAARFFKQIAGYDRAMVYRFDDEGHGEVLAERRNPELESYLGQRYPASDIPQIARRLYERNRVRLLRDVADERVPLQPRLSPLTGEDLDMSLCFLRAMSPIHIQYLQNMGVAATLVASLVVGGKLWGLVACHHYGSRLVHYEVRAACEVLAEAVATRIAALESFATAQAELSVRRIEQRMVEVISRDGDWRRALFDGAQSLLDPVDATGAALLFEGDVLTAGDVPGTQELRAIGAWLDERGTASVFATATLGRAEPAFARLASVASGLLAAPVSPSPGEYLLWFRPEQVRTVTWGGDPAKPFVVGGDPTELSPRRSFEKWHEQVVGSSEAWSAADLGAARLLGETVADVVLQFRSVRVLIAEDQLDNVRRQVRRSEHPVVIADPAGRILLSNEAFERLLPAEHPTFDHVSELAALFEDPAEVRSLLGDLLERRRGSRVELLLGARSGETRPILLRADPVLAAGQRLLGVVLLFTDLSERRAAETARRRFQEGIIAERRLGGADGPSDAAYGLLLSSVLGNAQLAALEITEGVDPGRMPRMLESVRVSLDRAAELLAQLRAHAPRRPGKRS